MWDMEAQLLSKSNDRASLRRGSGRVRYSPPEKPQQIELTSLLLRHGRTPSGERQLGFVLGDEGKDSCPIYYSGDVDVLDAPAVAIVGTRNVSREGAARARKLASGLAQAGITVVSGLAAGVDTEALTAAIKSGGRVAAVIGTPLDQAYPAQNKALQEEIYRDHLLISQFEAGQRTFPANFPMRNRLMAALTDATVVIEASDTSGTLHQSAECQRLGRWLFISKSVAENPKLEWPGKFLGYENCVTLESVEDVIERVS